MVHAIETGGIVRLGTSIDPCTSAMVFLSAPTLISGWSCFKLIEWQHIDNDFTWVLAKKEETE
jgi:hypothetical protein